VLLVLSEGRAKGPLKATTSVVCGVLDVLVSLHREGGASEEGGCGGNTKEYYCNEVGRVPIGFSTALGCGW